MRPITACRLATLALLAVATPASAQVQGTIPGNCAGNVVVTYMDTRPAGPGRFVYQMEIQNRSQQQRAYTLTFTSMPGDVTLRGNPYRSSIPVRPGARVQLTFGEGTRTANLTLATVLVTSDGVYVSGTPAVRIHDCNEENFW